MIVYLLIVPATDVDSECQSNSIELTGCIQTVVRFVTKLGRSRLGSPPLTTFKARRAIQLASPPSRARKLSWEKQSGPLYFDFNESI